MHFLICLLSSFHLLQSLVCLLPLSSLHLSCSRSAVNRRIHVARGTDCFSCQCVVPDLRDHDVNHLCTRVALGTGCFIVTLSTCCAAVLAYSLSFLRRFHICFFCGFRLHHQCCCILLILHFCRSNRCYRCCFTLALLFRDFEAFSHPYGSCRLLRRLYPR